MKSIKNIEVLGDSLLKGIQVNPVNKKYQTKNDIDFDMLSREYALSIKNDSRFGCTVTKGARILLKKLDTGLNCDAVVMDFGGNDCDYKWAEIAENPEGDFSPNTPLKQFIEEYTCLIQTLKSRGILPILTTLPPLDPQRFFNWWCQNLNKKNVMKWLGSIGHISDHQATYSSAVEALAASEHVPLIDIRSAFLRHGTISDLICEDGTHPNSKGQQIITGVFQSFAAEKLPVVLVN
ncbi:SGNH/GDSL hydrolase family protein [Faecalicatena orotica]|uniref:SGNH/GDSL hydrolase family protein n=1 Tax=Faecalicatena orotica TaxID=1544 RepID=UPI003216E0EE